MAMAAAVSGASSMGASAMANPNFMGLAATGVSAGGKLGVEAMRSGLGLLGQGRAIKSQEKMQQESMNFSREMLNRRDSAFSQAGLPTFLGYGGAGMMPRVSQAAGGGNFYTSQIPGNPQSAPYLAGAQSAFGWGNVQ